MYIFGGAYNGATGNSTWSLENRMDILDTIELTWSIGSQLQAPTPRDGYSATLLRYFFINKLFNNLFYIYKIYLYDTKNNAWETMISVGTIPDARAHHSSVLGLNNDRIIIYGGFYSLASPAVAHDLSVLDIRNKPYRWFTPNISGTIPPTPSAHTANVVGRYMIVTYGVILSRQYMNPDVYILDIGNDSEYKWVTSFDPKSPPRPGPSSGPSPIQSGYSISSGTMIGAIIGTFIGGILLTIFALMIYRWYKRKHPRATPTL
ncbi:galactose oxidase [Gigaspora margarita]|uniref:Galactose oxidase n=1 Tax=Gigaspora margarita TaxID=4874 RepID=A0A8H3X9D7_GIGMA|nr:galactose oxidase [Gigaspora margarita]